MRKIIITFITAAIGVVSANGQSKNTLLQRINEIKSQTEVFFWDQATFENTDTAKYVATERLLQYINNNRTDGELLSIEEVMPHTSYISMDRGNRKQCFAYIKKADAAAIKRGGIVDDAALPVVAGVPSNSASMPTTAPVPVKKSFIPEAFVMRIMEAKNFTNVCKLLKALQSQGQVLQFGKLKDVEDYSSLDLILFDMHSQEMVTMLSSVTASGQRINMVDGKEDSLDNYPTNLTAVIWYIKK